MRVNEFTKKNSAKKKALVAIFVNFIICTHINIFFIRFPFKFCTLLNYPTSPFPLLIILIIEYRVTSRNTIQI